MQAHSLEVLSLAKIVFYPKKFYYPLLLPSHNCINNHNVQFSRCIFVEIKSTFCAFNASIKCSLRLCFSSPVKTRFAGLLTGSWASFKKLNEVMIAHSFSQSLEWWRVPGSNRWPPACKAGALPAELTPHTKRFIRSGGPKWTRTIDLTIISRVL